MSDDRATELRSYGRMQGRALRPAQQRLADEMLPKIELQIPDQAPLDPAQLFSFPIKQCWLEIGFGGGEHLAAQAMRHPDIGMIGCEPYLNGVVKLLSCIDRDDIANIRLWRGDARRLIDRLPAASIERIFLLFPDPWPKGRQIKRRFVSPETIAALARIVRPGGGLRMASDHPDYIEAMLRVMRGSADFSWLAKGPEDFMNPPSDWIVTRYQEKTQAQGRAPVFLDYERTGRNM